MKQRSIDAAQAIFSAALEAADPYGLTRLQAERIVRAGEGKKIVVTGFGKAAYAMAQAVEELAGNLISGGIIIAKYGHGGREKIGRIRVREAGHPIPDDKGVKATEELIRTIKASPPDSPCICLISGGGSSLLASPWEGISLQEKQRITAILLRAGADVTELNTVRKHISRVKGGRLAEIAFPRPVLSLILSDVIGNRLDVIASGPTAPDSTGHKDAWDVLRKFNLLEKAPLSVVSILDKGMEGRIPETPKGDSPVFQAVENLIIGSNSQAMEKARLRAESMGFITDLTPEPVTGEAREAGRKIAQQALRLKKEKGEGPPLCIISGGETTVTVTGNGKGGRNTELALAFAMEIGEAEGITLLSAGTDGTDGPTDAAGAVVDKGTMQAAKARGLDPLEYLRNNDSYSFFREINGLVITGPTGTNVMDIQIVVIE
ncbi:MAG: glycerate kinase [Thermodesulfovibrionales bacterium]|jgi:hydroxypyruvate reductase/glycerate 2-kinase